jgi:transcriptional regulator with XRE-family HTH domain
MITGIQLRAKRNSAGIAGSLVCVKAGIARSRLSDIEREYVVASEDEVARIDAALDELARAKRKIAAVAAEEGWPSSL